MSKFQNIEWTSYFSCFFNCLSLFKPLCYSIKHFHECYVLNTIFCKILLFNWIRFVFLIMPSEAINIETSPFIFIIINWCLGINHDYIVWSCIKIMIQNNLIPSIFFPSSKKMNWAYTSVKIHMHLAAISWAYTFLSSW